ncbi:hypothetical protein VA596_47765 [Amycolatopsis sp., V23-08]|uniref:Uncharacterized protein n=1 Tax=Amycolatopsis heterodermiae TaxID=3110235 RepID=A0ABU5RP27_9PSEU|nr:hypothetical protein [Amycolatopsis sp., V23-08]MEA5367299.1 hypothetical protein [Amycolatopsis sp., V23-08]
MSKPVFVQPNLDGPAIVAAHHSRPGLTCLTPPYVGTINDRTAPPP